MRPARLLAIAAAAAVAAGVAAETWSLTESYRDARACLNALPALEENGELVVNTLSRSRDLPEIFEIGYQAIGTVDHRPGRLRCAFGDGLDGRRHLLGIELSGRLIGDARLYFLERFWLDDPTAVQSGAARLRIEVPPLAFLAAIVGRPHLSLIGAILCAILAIAALAVGRFAGKPRQR